MAQSCFLCGIRIGNNNPSRQAQNWLEEFRVIYAEGCDWASPQLSGVGCYDPPHWNVPISPKARYDDPGMRGSAGLREVILMKFHEDQLWGYPFHEICWQLLSRVCYPLTVDVSALFKFCRSHGVYFMRHVWNPYSGREDLNIDSLKLCLDNPMKPRPLELIYPEAKRDSPGNSIGPPTSGGEYHGDSRDFRLLSLSTDPLFSLPLEIRDYILRLLPSKDACSVRLASRAFAQFTSFSQAFWFSRFFPPFELGFIFEAMDSSPSLYDWKLMYQQLRHNNEPVIRDNHLLNRKRIWTLASPLASVLPKLSQTKLNGEPIATAYEPELNGQLYEANLLRRFDADDLYSESRLPISVFLHRGHAQPYEGRGAGVLLLDECCPLPGCRRLFSRAVKLPQQLTGVFVSVIDIGGHSYVTGLRFVDKAGLSTRLGFIRPQDEICIKPKDNIDNGSSFNLSGFKLAIDDNTGVRAFAIATESGKVSLWAGDPKGAYRWLVPFDDARSISMLNADFDAYKLLRVYTPDERQGFTSLRTSVPWMPKVPPLNWCLNEPSYRTSSSDCLFMRRPLTHAHFGGPKGIYLSHVAFLAVWILRESTVMGIEIGYDTDDLPTYSLGLCTHSQIQSQPTRESMGRNSTSRDIKRIVFDIKGSKGEYITAVYGSKMLMRMNGVPLFKFRVHTSFSRILEFPPPVPGDFELKVEYDYMGPTLSTTITGFYTEPSTLQLEKIWVISEEVDHIKPRGQSYPNGIQTHG